jgi:hypothetical protein
MSARRRAVGELDAATEAHGLAVTGARVPGPGVAAAVLDGGSGWLAALSQALAPHAAPRADAARARRLAAVRRAWDLAGMFADSNPLRPRPDEGIWQAGR